MTNIYDKMYDSFYPFIVTGDTAVFFGETDPRFMVVLKGTKINDNRIERLYDDRLLRIKKEIASICSPLTLLEIAGMIEDRLEALAK